jgi:hypothetical protein
MRGANANDPSPSVLAPVRAVFRAFVVTVVPDAKQLKARLKQGEMHRLFPTFATTCTLAKT